jgi:hypothetical protein
MAQRFGWPLLQRRSLFSSTFSDEEGITVGKGIDDENAITTRRLSMARIKAQYISASGSPNL